MNPGPYFYETHLYWKGRRRGLIEVAELPPVMTSAPPEFQGEPGFWTPEHLLVAALESCLLTTFLAIAERSQLEVISYRSSSMAKLELIKASGLELTQITVRPIVKIRHERDRQKVSQVYEKTKKNCLISKALSVPIQVNLDIEVSELLEAQSCDEAAGVIPGNGYSR